MSNNEYFKYDRYTKEEFLTGFEKVESLDKVIYIDINDDQIEIYLKEIQSYNREYIREILSDIESFDRVVQNFCEENYKCGNHDYKDYAVELSWMSLEKDKVTIRYWGEFVNIELEAIFINENNKWTNKDIYYC